MALQPLQGHNSIGTAVVAIVGIASCRARCFKLALHQLRMLSMLTDKGNTSVCHTVLAGARQILQEEVECCKTGQAQAHAAAPSLCAYPGSPVQGQLAGLE